MLRVCGTCSQLFEGMQCHVCSTIGPRGRPYRRERARVLAEEQLCYICGLPAQPGDPLEAGHLIARVMGGPDTRENMRAMHRSCNNALGSASVK